MRKILIDAGPVIALFRRNDRYHQKAVAFLASFEGRLITTWPVITEVMYVLKIPEVQEKFLLWLERCGMEIFSPDTQHITALGRLIKTYSNIPMDFADASLIVCAEETGIREIATIDSDFYVYRTIRNKYLTNIFL